MEFCRYYTPADLQAMAGAGATSRPLHLPADLLVDSEVLQDTGREHCRWVAQSRAAQCSTA